MICFQCSEGNHNRCHNTHTGKGERRPEELKTQCACQHSEIGMIDSTQCKHLKIDSVTRICGHCQKHIPLIMTKAQAEYTLNCFVDEFCRATSEEERNESVSAVAERFLNDRPTHSRDQAEASISEM